MGLRKVLLLSTMIAVSLFFAVQTSKGWKLQVDHEASSQVALGVEPPDGLPCELGYHTVDEYYSALEQLNSQYPQLTELVNYGKSACLAKVAAPHPVERICLACVSWSICSTIAAIVQMPRGWWIGNTRFHG